MLMNSFERKSNLHSLIHCLKRHLRLLADCCISRKSCRISLHCLNSTFTVVEKRINYEFCTKRSKVLTWPHTWSGPTFCPVGISSPIWTQKLWNFKYALYSMLCTYPRCFFEPNCFERNEEIWAVVTLAVGIWIANTLTTWQISTVYAPRVPTF